MDQSLGVNLGEEDLVDIIEVSLVINWDLSGSKTPPGQKSELARNMEINSKQGMWRIIVSNRDLTSIRNWDRRRKPLWIFIILTQWSEIIQFTCSAIKFNPVNVQLLKSNYTVYVYRLLASHFSSCGRLRVHLDLLRRPLTPSLSSQ